MKKWIGSLVVGIVFFGGVSFAVESAEAFRRAYDQWILQLNPGVLGSSHLKRQQIAPLLRSYIAKVVKKDYTNRWCKAIDIKNADSNYQEDLEILCGYGILLGEKNRLLPQHYLTNAQAIALVMRVVDGYQKEENGTNHWAAWYFERAKTLGYEGITPIYYKKNFPITLESFINFLYSIEHPNQSIRPTDYDTLIPSQSSNFKSSDDALLKLAEILKS